jgi:hypothetical protein
MEEPMATQAQPFRPSRTVGFWLAAAIAALQGVNALRTVLNPQGFATYMGLPVDQLSALGWVQVYGLRAGFIAVLTAVLLARSDFAALRWMALAALLMPLGDASLAASAGAGPAIVGRHLAIAVFLIIAAVFLGRAAARKGAQP